MKLERHKYSVEFYEECSNYIKEGHSLTECAEKYNINYATLRQNLTKLVLRTPSRKGNINNILSFD